MLKDLINKRINKSKKNDKINLSIMDGFVDVKGYDKDGKLFYHDCGDNVVTDWMRHSIISMLAGIAFARDGEKLDVSKHSSTDSEKVGRINEDGYLLSNEQFFYNNVENRIYRYCKSNIPGRESNNYALFPTKILLGTGKEFQNWDTLRLETENIDKVAYANWVKEFGGEGNVDAAQKNFDNGIEKKEDPLYNNLSGTLETGITSGDGKTIHCRTVNDPDTSATNIATSTSMYKNYNVVGAIKTPYMHSTEDYNMLEPVRSQSGKLLKPQYRGVGNPCFIYFGQDDKQENWDQEGLQIRLSYDDNNKYLTKISFTITLAGQKSGNAINDYYPYNGWTLKQIGLYNDSLIFKEKNDLSDVSENMRHGTLLAVKNINPVTKIADSSYRITWTLTI